MVAAESRDTLLTRKRDLFDAIRILEADRAEGTVDEAAYQSARRRYELEAAAILQRLDESGGEQSVMASRRRLPSVLLALALLAALGFLVMQALHARSGTEAVTGSEGAPNPVATAQAGTGLHPRSYAAYLALGGSLLNAGRTTEADAAYRRAMALAPGRPEAPTLDAMVQTYEGRAARALDLLAGVERSDPHYARAWLLDGLIAMRVRADRGRAVRAFHQFLRLQPSGPVASQVRGMLRPLEHGG